MSLQKRFSKKTGCWLIITMVVASSIYGEIEQGPMIEVSSRNEYQWSPSVAYNDLDDEYLVVRSDYPVNSSIGAVWGTRLDKSGAVLDEFLIASGDYARDNPSVAFSPSTGLYLVVWEHDFPGDGSDWDILGRLIPRTGPDGSLGEIYIQGELTSQFAPQVTFNEVNSEFFVVWHNGSFLDTRWVEGQRINATDGNPIGSSLVIAQGAESRKNPDVTYNRTNNEYFVVYEKETNSGDIWGRLVSATGLLGPEVGIAGWPDAERWPKVSASYSTDSYVVTWSGLSSGIYNIYARRLNGEGVVVGAPILVEGSPVGEFDSDIEALPGQGLFLIVWSQQYGSPTGHLGVRARTIDTGGVLGAQFDPAKVYTNEDIDNRWPVLCGTDRGWFVGWGRQRIGTVVWDTYGRLAFNYLFADGFETADTSEWSAVSP